MSNISFNHSRDRTLPPTTQGQGFSQGGEPGSLAKPRPAAC